MEGYDLASVSPLHGQRSLGEAELAAAVELAPAVVLPLRVDLPHRVELALPE